MTDNTTSYNYNGKPNYTVIILFALLLLYFMIKAELAKSSALNNENKILDDENYNLASQLHSAFNINLLSDYFTTFNEKQLFEIATKIKDFKKVQEAYYALYSETLISRLEKTFVDFPDKLNLFYATVKANANTGTGSSTGNTQIPTAGNLKLNAKVSAIKITDAFDYEDSTQVLKRFSTGEEVGTYLGDYFTTIKGFKYAVVEISVHWYTPNKKVLILKQNLISY